MTHFCLLWYVNYLNSVKDLNIIHYSHTATVFCCYGVLTVRLIFTDRVGKAISSVRSSVCLSFCQSVCCHSVVWIDWPSNWSFFACTCIFRICMFCIFFMTLGYIANESLNRRSQHWHTHTHTHTHIQSHIQTQTNTATTSPIFAPMILIFVNSQICRGLSYKNPVWQTCIFGMCHQTSGTIYLPTNVTLTDSHTALRSALKINIFSNAFNF